MLVASPLISSGRLTARAGARLAARASPRSSAPAFSATAAPPAAELPSFSRALFGGKLASQALMPYPRPAAAEQDDLRQLVSSTEAFYASGVNNAAKNDATASIPEATRAGLREIGAYGMQVPEALGGIGANNTAYGRLSEVLGGNDLGLAIHLGAHQSIGFKGIMLFGTEAQKAKYLPKCASGEHVAAFSLTEAGAGSDANSVKTRAVRQADGSWRITGTKLWTSNGGEAAVLTVFAQTEVDDPKAPGGKADKVTAFIVERAFGGLTNGPPEKKMGIKCSNTAEVYYDNVPVPAENVLGGVGQGFKVAVEILNAGRFGMGCMLSGTMKSCLKGAAEHAAQRSQFGKKLKDFGLIKGKIAGMATRIFATESAAFALAANMDRGMTDFALEAAISKVFASEAAWHVADESIQVLGGQGFMAALPYERVLRDLRIFRIFEGANDILRLFVVGEGLKSLGKALRAGSPVAAGLSAARTALGLAPSPPLLPAALVPERLRPAAAAVEAGAASFGAGCTALLMKHGKGIGEFQLLLERLADVAIDLTVMTAAISRAASAPADTRAHETDLARLFCAEATLRLVANLKAMEAPGAAALERHAGSFADVATLKHLVADAVFAHGGYIARHPTGV